MTTRRLAGCLFALAPILYLVERFCLTLQLPGTNSSPVWLSAGIGVAAVALWGAWPLPSIFIAGFLANLMTLPPPVAYVASLPIAVGHVLQAALVGLMMRRLMTTPVESWPVASVLWVLGAALVGAVGSATIGVGALSQYAVLPTAAVPMAFGTWATGDVLGILVLAPPLVLFGEGARWPTRR